MMVRRSGLSGVGHVSVTWQHPCFLKSIKSLWWFVKQCGFLPVETNAQTRIDRLEAYPTFVVNQSGSLGRQAVGENREAVLAKAKTLLVVSN